MPDRYSLILKSEFTEAEKVLPFVDAIGKEWNLDDSLTERLKLALSEAASNAIVHGNREQPEKSVTILIEVNEDQLIATVSDEGDGFNPDTLPNPVKEKQLLKPGGRGIFLIEEFCDEVDYINGGNTLKLIFTR